MASPRLEAPMRRTSAEDLRASMGEAATEAAAHTHIIGHEGPESVDTREALAADASARSVPRDFIVLRNGSLPAQLSSTLRTARALLCASTHRSTCDATPPGQSVRLAAQLMIHPDYIRR